jgi:hypothetical protein
MRARVNLKPLFCLTAFLGTGFFVPSASAATFVYVGNADSQDVAVLELKSSGDLTPVETAAVPGPAKPGGSLPLALGLLKDHDVAKAFFGVLSEPLGRSCSDPQSGKDISAADELVAEAGIDEGRLADRLRSPHPINGGCPCAVEPEPIAERQPS